MLCSIYLCVGLSQTGRKVLVQQGQRSNSGHFVLVIWLKVGCVGVGVSVCVCVCGVHRVGGCVGVGVGGGR